MADALTPDQARLAREVIRLISVEGPYGTQISDGEANEALLVVLTSNVGATASRLSDGDVDPEQTFVTNALALFGAIQLLLAGAIEKVLEHGYQPSERQADDGGATDGVIDWLRRQMGEAA